MKRDFDTGEACAAIKRLRGIFFNEPEFWSRKQKREIQRPEDFKEFELSLLELLKGPAPIIFIIGEWGSGKTKQIELFQENHSDNFDFRPRSFFSVQNLREGYFHLLSGPQSFWAVVLFLLLSLIYHSFTTKDWLSISAFVYVLVAFAFFTNRLKLLYICGCIVDILGLCLLSKYRNFMGEEQGTKERVLILEDLDRSSMTFEEQWGMLANLWTFKQRYIVSYGFNPQFDRARVIEMVQKLEARFIELPIFGSTNSALLSSIFPDPPTVNPDFLEFFRPRELIEEVANLQQRVSNLQEQPDKNITKKSGKFD